MVTEDEVRKGLGSVLSLTDPARIRELQRIAVEESRLGIPPLFAFDPSTASGRSSRSHWAPERASTRKSPPMTPGSARVSRPRLGSSRPTPR